MHGLEQADEAEVGADEDQAPRQIRRCSSVRKDTGASRNRAKGTRPSRSTRANSGRVLGKRARPRGRDDRIEQQQEHEPVDEAHPWALAGAQRPDQRGGDPARDRDAIEGDGDAHVAPIRPRMDRISAPVRISAGSSTISKRSLLAPAAMPTTAPTKGSRLTSRWDASTPPTPPIATATSAISAMATGRAATCPVGGQRPCQRAGG